MTSSPPLNLHPRSRLFLVEAQITGGGEVRKWMVVGGLATVLTVSAVPTVSAEPSPQASCNGLFSYLDAQGQLRDDVSHIFKELSAEFEIPPGWFHKETPRPCG